MGYTMMLLFLPGGFIGTLMFWAIAISLATFSHLIPHEKIAD